MITANGEAVAVWGDRLRWREVLRSLQGSCVAWIGLDERRLWSRWKRWGSRWYEMRKQMDSCEVEVRPVIAWSHCSQWSGIPMNRNSLILKWRWRIFFKELWFDLFNSKQNVIQWRYLRCKWLVWCLILESLFCNIERHASKGYVTILDTNICYLREIALP